MKRMCILIGLLLICGCASLHKTDVQGVTPSRKVAASPEMKSLTLCSLTIIAPHDDGQDSRTFVEIGEIKSQVLDIIDQRSDIRFAYEMLNQKRSAPLFSTLYCKEDVFSVEAPSQLKLMRTDNDRILDQK